MRVAGKIVSDNIASGRAPKEEGVLLMVVSPYWDLSERGAAEEKSRYLADVARNVLAESFPNLQFDTLVGLVAMGTRLLEPIELEKPSSGKPLAL